MLLIRGGKIKPIVGEEMENGELLIGDDGSAGRFRLSGNARLY